MNSILEDLYFGRIIPWERKVPRSDEYHELNRKIETEQEYLISKLSEKDRQRLEAFKNLVFKISSYEEVDIFSCGFRLGSMLVMNVFTEIEDT